MGTHSGWQLPVYLFLAVVVCGAVPSPAQQPSAPDPAALSSILRYLGETPEPLAAPGVTTCVERGIECGQTRNATLNTLDCVTTNQDTYFDIWTFNGQSGDMVTIDMTSTQVDPFLLLLDPNLDLFASDDDGGPGLNARISTTLDQTGLWGLSASGLPGLAQTGAYTLSLDCQQVTPPPPSGPCDPDDPQSLCLVDDRFQVQVDWRTNQGTSGQGTAVRLTPDTGYFWFFNQSNVELVVKVLDTCSFSNRFWVFAGGLTNVEVDITVTDTQENATKTYHNDLNTPFQPIQDTNAFATCP
jgi:hypothetical protein